MSAIAPQMERIVGSEAVLVWDSVPPPLQRQIQAALVPSAAIACWVAPNTVDELAEVMSCAFQNRWAVLPMGAGSKLPWGGLATAAQVAISTARLNRVIDHAIGDLTLTAEAGTPFAEVRSLLAAQRQCLAITPTYADRATLGGIVATADTGFSRQRYGGVRDMLIGISFVRSDGQLVKAGGRVVKNVAGYDLMKLLTGSYGSLGIISQVTFRLYPLPETSETVVLSGSAAAIARSLQVLLASALTPTAIELLASPTAAALNLGQPMGLVVRFQSIPISLEQQASQLMQIAEKLDLRGDRLTGEAESDLWQHLQDQLETAHTPASVTCKIGVFPANAVTVLDKISHHLDSLELDSLATGLIHAGSGLGILRFSAIDPAALLFIRDLCQAHGGFLSILEAPIAWKQQLDVWGYTGNAIDLMRMLKQQFDPNARLSPGRFVAGI